MIKLDKTPMDFNSRAEMTKKLSKYKSELYNLVLMSGDDSAFLCGLLRTCRPKKILEVGVAAGGSTAIILQVLEDIGESYEMHSVDLRKKHWQHTTEDIGFLATIVKENNLLTTPPRSTLCGTHEFHLGKYLPQVIDEIGGNIDFVIFDTVHFLPGELLDFPVMLPYLKDGAIVVIHDVALHQRSTMLHWNEGYATGLLFGAVTASEKFLNFVAESKSCPFQYPNISAFRIDKQTREYIENVFLSLVLPWHYLPGDAEIKIYREFYAKHYPAELVNIFDETVKMNRNHIALKDKQ